MNKTADVRLQIVTTVNKILSDSGRPSCQPTDRDTLNSDLGLDSLDLAVLVVTLEQRLGVDPFRDGSTAVHTLGDLVDVYVEAVKS